MRILTAIFKGFGAAMEQDGGSLVILGQSKLDAWGSPGDALPLMRAVKEQFDPKGTLNPGTLRGRNLMQT